MGYDNFHDYYIVGLDSKTAEHIQLELGQITRPSYLKQPKKEQSPEKD